MIDERLEEQAVIYALGGLSAEESRTFEAAMRRDPELRKLVDSLRTPAAALAGNVPRVSPPPEQRILDTIDEREKVVPISSHSAERGAPVVWIPWALAACLAALCVVMKVSQSRVEDRHYALNLLVATLQDATNTLGHTVSELNSRNRLANIRIATLTSQPAGSKTAAVVWDDQNQKGVIVVQNMEALPADKDYQLWVIDPKYKTPVPAGVFQVDANGSKRFEFVPAQPIQAATKFAITREPKGGSPEPHLDQLMLIGG